MLEWVNQGHLSTHFNFPQLFCSYLPGGQVGMLILPQTLHFVHLLIYKIFSLLFRQAKYKSIGWSWKSLQNHTLPFIFKFKAGKACEWWRLSVGITLLTMEGVWISKGQAPTYVSDWFTQAHKSSKWRKLEVEVRNATCAMTHGAILKEHLTEWFQVSAQLSRIGTWVN